MNIKIHAIHFTASEQLDEFINNKISKLAHFYDSIIGAEVFLRLDKSPNNNINTKIAKIKLEIPGHDPIAEKQALSFEEAIDEAIDALKKQLIAKKEKVRGA